MSLDWTDEAWRERWAKLARARDDERAAHQTEVDRWMAQLLEPVALEQLRVEVQLFEPAPAPVVRARLDAWLESRIDVPQIEVEVTAERDGMMRVRVRGLPIWMAEAMAQGEPVYSDDVAGPDRSDHVPDPAAPDRDPG